MSKRGDGEGTIRQRPDGRWEGRLRHTNHVTNLPTQSSFYGATKAEVRAKIEKARGRVKDEAPVRDSTMRLADWLAHWMETALEASDRAYNTKQQYKCLARKHLSAPPFGNIRLDRLRKSDIDALLMGMRKKGLSDSTIRSSYTALRLAIEDARLDSLLAENVVARVKRPKVPKTEATYLPTGDVTALLKAAEGLRYHRLLLLIAGSGLRRGEAAGMQWEKVDLDTGLMKVRATLVRVSGKGLVLQPHPKSNSIRDIPLSPPLVAMLRKHRIAQLEERLAAGDRWVDSGFVFTTELGGPVDPRNVLRTVEIAAAKAGVGTAKGADKAKVHTLRHSAATAWLEQGTHVKAVADLLGHSSISITGDLYGHTAETVSRAAVDGLSETLGL